MQEYGVCEEAILGELPHAQANQGLPTEGLTMLEKGHGWCIVKYHNTDEDRKCDYDLLVRLEHQWMAQRLNGKWEVMARGFKTAHEAMFYLPLYKD